MATEEQTCEVDTNDISAVALVLDSGFDIRATIDFERGDRRGAGAPLQLCDTDVLTIEGEAPTETIKASSVEYSRSLPVDADRSITFALDRQAQGDRLELQLELPPAFELLTPMDGDEVVLGQDLPLTWEPARPDAIMRVRLAEPLGGGACVGTDDTSSPSSPYKEPGGVQVPDSGAATIAAADLRPLGAPDASCEIDITLARVVLGAYPDAFTSGGRIEGRVERTVDLLTVR
ncbi:MAG: hypothetical protein AB1Z98_02165 [Nannocystaceae bacterium]